MIVTESLCGFTIWRNPKYKSTKNRYWLFRIDDMYCLYYGSISILEPVTDFALAINKVENQ